MIKPRLQATRLSLLPRCSVHLPFVFQRAIEWVDGDGLTLQKYELWRLFSGPLWATGSRIPWERFESFETPHQLACFALKKSTY